jgi:hypothetical protein
MKRVEKAGGRQPDWQNPAVLQRGREPARTDFVTFQDRETHNLNDPFKRARIWPVSYQGSKDCSDS